MILNNMKIDLQKIIEGNYSAIEEGILYAKYIEDIYLDYFNNYLSIDKFALDYACTYEEAKKIIALGRFINNEILN